MPARKINITSEPWRIGRKRDDMKQLFVCDICKKTGTLREGNMCEIVESPSSNGDYIHKTCQKKWNQCIAIFGWDKNDV